MGCRILKQHINSYEMGCFFRLQRYIIPFEIGTEKQGFFEHKKSAEYSALIVCDSLFS